MHDDIRSGGEAGKKVLQQLGGSAEAMETEGQYSTFNRSARVGNATDQADQRVLELLDLLDQPQISVPPSEAGGDTLAQPQFGSTTAAAAAAELEEAEVEELDREARTRQPTDYSVQTRTSDDGLPLGASASQIGGAASRPSDDVVPAAPPALNFLQEDELVEKAADPVEGVSQAVLNEVRAFPQSRDDQLMASATTLGRRRARFSGSPKWKYRHPTRPRRFAQDRLGSRRRR